MLKKTFILPLLFLSILAQSQDMINLKGVLLRNTGEYAAGDTINVSSKKINQNSGQVQYGIRMQYGNTRFINEDRIQLVNNDLDFWEDIWFTYRAQDIQKNGWEKEKRNELLEDAMDYYSTALQNNLVFEEELLYDYLYQLVHLIHPVPMLKEKQRDLSILVLKSTEKSSFAFDNGMIVLTTGMLSNLKNEEDLIRLLSKNIGHIVLEHNLENFNRALKSERRARIWGTIATAALATAMAVDEIQTGRWHDYGLAADFGASIYFLSTSTLGNIGASYTMDQEITARNISREFINLYPEIIALDKKQFLSQIAPAISANAWLEFHFKNYSAASHLIHRLEENNIATDSDYFLMSKILRKQSNDLDSNSKALSYIQKGKSKSLTIIPEFFKEEGMIYNRLGEIDKSTEAFLSYRKYLIDLKEKGENVDSELRSIEQYIQRSNVSNGIKLHGEVMD
jgi:hypothetical protein